MLDTPFGSDVLNCHLMDKVLPSGPKQLRVMWRRPSVTSTNPRPASIRFPGWLHWLRVYFHQRRPWPHWKTFQSQALGDWWGTSQPQRQTSGNSLCQLQLRSFLKPQQTSLSGCHWCWANRTRGSWPMPRQCFQLVWWWWGQCDNKRRSETAAPTNLP